MNGSIAEVLSNRSLSELKDGAVEELYKDALAKVVRNMQDPNCPAGKGKGARRSIVITMDMVPDDSRSFVMVDVTVEAKLAQPAPVATAFSLKEDSATNTIVAFEPEQDKLFRAPTN